jgi:hypothetical protein
MTNPDPTPIGETLEQILERAIFADPVTHRLRDEWEATKRDVQELFENACRAQHEEQLAYHQTYHTPNAEEQARVDASALRIFLIEERDRRLALVWADILRRVEAVLAEKEVPTEETGA